MKRGLAVVAVAVLLGTGCSSSDGDGDSPAANGPTTVPHGERATMPSPRTEVAGATWQGLMVAAGGLTRDGAVTDRVDLYDPATDSWRPGPALPLPLHHVGLASFGDRLYLAGGYATGSNGGWETQDAVFSVGPGENTWRREPVLLRPRGALTLVAGDDRLVAVGGVSDDGVTATTELLVPGEQAWRPGPDLAQAREHLGGAAIGGRLYAIGGRMGSLESNLESVESWDPQAEATWRSEPALNDSRGGTAAASVGGGPCVAGGEEPEGTIASVECLIDGRWQRVARLATPRHGLAVAGLGETLHVAGGGPTPGLSVSGAHEVFDVG